MTTDQEYTAGTVEHGARSIDPLFAADGKKSGHGTVAWLPAPAYAMLAHPPWAPPPKPQVIALLDTGVRTHSWLDVPGPQTFVQYAEALGFPSPVPQDDSVQTGDYHSHWGHATFIAGLIRLAAPAAQLLSMRVMNSQGKVSEEHVADALRWLADHLQLPGLGRVGIVLMAFGRQEDPGSKDLSTVRAPLEMLADSGVRIVASAGNDASDLPVYPAAFAAEPKLSRSVVSVGALDTPTVRASYSNFGPWVTRWAPGTNAISIMPLTIASDEPGSGPAVAGLKPVGGDGYAWWSGTSFAAAAVAGQLATGLPVSQPLPEPAAGS